MMTGKLWKIQVFTACMLLAVSTIANPYVTLCRLDDSPSMPGWLYLCTRNAPKILMLGDKIILDNPIHENGTRILKIVGGLPGDAIHVENGREFTVAGNFRGFAKRHARDGRPLKPFSAPSSIPPGYVFITTPHTDSYDSRYEEIGLRPIASIHAKAWRLW